MALKCQRRCWVILCLIWLLGQNRSHVLQKESHTLSQFVLHGLVPQTAQAVEVHVHPSPPARSAMTSSGSEAQMPQLPARMSQNSDVRISSIPILRVLYSWNRHFMRAPYSGLVCGPCILPFNFFQGTRGHPKQISLRRASSSSLGFMAKVNGASHRCKLFGIQGCNGYSFDRNWCGQMHGWELLQLGSRDPNKNMSGRQWPALPRKNATSCFGIVNVPVGGHLLWAVYL